MLIYALYYTHVFINIASLDGLMSRGCVKPCWLLAYFSCAPWRVRNPPKLLGPDDFKKLDPQSNAALSLLADQAYIFGCMHYVLCNESKYKVADFNFQLRGSSALVTAKQKFKKDDIRFYVLTDQIT